MNKLKTRNFLLVLLFLGSLFSFLYVNYDAHLNKDTASFEDVEAELMLEEEDVSNTSIMPDVHILYKVGTVVKHLLPISE